MTPWFVALERFTPACGEAWDRYIAWSKLTQLDGIISLDFSLCPLVLNEMKDAYWPYVSYFVVYGFFTDLAFLKAPLAETRLRALARGEKPERATAAPDSSSDSASTMDRRQRLS